MWTDADAGTTLWDAADAHRTGGLADTIQDGETGFLFSELSGEGLFGACRRAFEVTMTEALDEMRQAAMARSFLWSGAAEEYAGSMAKLTGQGWRDRCPRPARPRRSVERAAAAA